VRSGWSSSSALILLCGPVYERVVDRRAKTGQIDMGRAIHGRHAGRGRPHPPVVQRQPEAAVKGGVNGRESSSPSCSILVCRGWDRLFFEGNQGGDRRGISALREGSLLTFAGGLFRALDRAHEPGGDDRHAGSVRPPTMGSRRNSLSVVSRRQRDVFLCPRTAPCLRRSRWTRPARLRIGKYLLNHSFMLPTGLVSTLASTASALLLSSILVGMR